MYAMYVPGAFKTLLLVLIRERRMHGRRNGLIGRTSMLYERAGQFEKAVHCKVTRHLKTEALVGLKT